MHTRDLRLEGLLESRVIEDDYPEMAFCEIQMAGYENPFNFSLAFKRL